MTYSKLDDPDYLCVQIVELTAEVERLTATLENQESALHSCIESHEFFERDNERLTAENQHLFNRANDVMAENERLTDQIRKLVDSFNSGEIGAWAGAVINEELTAENERLREALRPFADIYNRYRHLPHTIDMQDMRLDTYRHFYKEAAEALAPDYFQRGVEAAPGLVLTGTEEQE